jgi:ABC-type sugar transport system substrate-binding protein
MRRFGSKATVLAAVAFTAALAGCGGSSGASASPAAASATPAAAAASASPAAAASASPAPASAPVIGISVKTITNDPFQTAWVNAATSKIEALGGKVRLLVAGGETAVATQASQLNDLIAQQVNGMIVNPIDGAAVVPVLQKAKDAKIPVVTVDSPVAPGNDGLFETFIATDNVKAGSDLATYLVTNIGKPNPNVAIIEGAPGSLAGDDRKKGFLAGLATKNVTPVASASGEWQNAKALTAMENILTAHPDLDAVLSASDVMVDGILQALAGASKTNVKVLAIDGSKVGIQGVIDGKLLADNTQDPAQMGTLAAQDIFGLANGTIARGSLPKYIDSGTQTVTKENAQQALAKAF